MKLALGAALAGLFVISPALLHADGGSAYNAIRTAKKQAGSGALVELVGERGEPRPPEWKLIYTDASARGGVREVVVSGDVIVSQRTPLRGYSSVGAQPPILPARLNLDSDGAFDVANRQAAAKRIGFNWVDYTLRANNVTGAPMWVLRLYDYMGAQVGVIQISAEDGSIIMPLEVAQYTPSESGNSGSSSSSQSSPRVGGVIGTVGNVLENTANTVKRTTLRTVGTVQEVLTGERTIGTEENE